MITLDKQNRTTISIPLFQDIRVLPDEAHYYRVYFSERTNCIIFSLEQRKGVMVQIGKVLLDEKRRLYFTKYLIDLIKQLLKANFTEMYFCLNQKGELCMKKVPP